MPNNCGFSYHQQQYKLVDVLLETYYLKKVPCKIRIKGNFPSGCNLTDIESISLESKYNNTLIRVLDIQQYGLNPDIIYPLSYLISLSPVVTNPSEKNFMHDILFNCYNYLHFLDKHGIEFKYDYLIVLANIDNLDNAFWNSSYLSFGNGTYGHTALTSSLIVAHELTHAVIDNIMPLEYQGLSGALNESFSDVFGICYEFYIHELYSNLGWELGSETGLILRNVREPELCNQPRKVKDKYYCEPDSFIDNGGVHINSGIPNHIFYCVQNIIGYKKAFEMWIRTLYKLNRYATFTDFKRALLLVNTSMNYIDRKKLSDVLDEHGL